MSTTAIPHPHRIPILRRLARDGDAYAQYALAGALKFGDGVPVDRPEAERLLRRAARTLVPAQLEMAELESERDGMLPDVRNPRARAWYARAALSHHPDALRHVAWRWLPHRGDPLRRRAATAALERAMRAGSAMAAYDLAVNVETLGGDLRRVRRLLEFADVVGMHQKEHELLLMLVRRAGPRLGRWSRRSERERRARARAGDLDARVLLGYAQRFGRGVRYDPSGAQRTWEAAASAGSTEAQIALALMAFDSEVDVALEDAARWAAKAAESGDLVAGWLTAELWRHGPAEGEGAAAFWQQRAAELGMPQAAYSLACGARWNGRGLASRRRAVRFARIAAQGGRALSMLADEYEDGVGVRRDEREATRWWRLAAIHGNYDDRTNLGVRLHEGRGTRRDDREAVRWYRRAAAHGCPAGTANLGRCYRAGHGVTKNSRIALRWFLRATEVLENPSAAGAISSMYGEGELGPADPAEMVRWERRAAAMGDVDGLCSLGASFHNGKHVRRDRSFAILLYRAAAEMGDDQSAYNLGLSYRDGEGVRRDLRSARKWWRLAAKRGSKEAVKALETSRTGRA